MRLPLFKIPSASATDLIVLDAFEYCVYWSGQSTDALRYQFIFDIDVPGDTAGAELQVFNHKEFDDWWILDVEERTYDSNGTMHLSPAAPMPASIPNPLSCPCCDLTRTYTGPVLHNMNTAAMNILREYGDYAWLDFTYTKPCTRYRVTLEADRFLDPAELKYNCNQFDIGARGLPDAEDFMARFGLVLMEPGAHNNIEYFHEKYGMCPLNADTNYWQLPLDVNMNMIIGFKNMDDDDEDENEDDIDDESSTVVLMKENEDDTDEDTGTVIHYDIWDDDDEVFDAVTGLEEEGCAEEKKAGSIEMGQHLVAAGLTLFWSASCQPT